jgi:hypothetical protein
MDEPTITCPSGLTGRVRGLKIGDLNTFAEAADSNAAKAAEIFDKILADCWVETVESGPVGSRFFNERTGKVDWSKALLTDQFYALIRIRMATKSLGHMYAFKHKCLECGHAQSVEVDLSTLELAMMDDDTTSKLAAGDNKFPGQFSDGTQFGFKVFTCADARKVAKVARKNKDARVSVGLTYRIVSICDPSVGMDHGHVITDQGQIREYLDNLDEGELDIITEQIDAIEGGVDSDIEFECEECYSDREARIPFGGAFWISAKKPKRSRLYALFGGMIPSADDDGPPLSWRLTFELCWTRGDALHGSGMSFTRQDVHNMTLDEALFHVERLGERREAERAAMKARKR